MDIRLLKTPVALALVHIQKQQFVGPFPYSESTENRTHGVVKFKLEGEVAAKQKAAIEATLEAYAKVGTRLAFANLEGNTYLFGISPEVKKAVADFYKSKAQPENEEEDLSNQGQAEEVAKAQEVVSEEEQPKPKRKRRTKAKPETEENE